MVHALQKNHPAPRRRLEADSGNILLGMFRPGGPMPRVPQEFLPVVLATAPPTLLTREEALKKVPHMKVLHIPATLPRNEDGPPTQSQHAR